MAIRSRQIGWSGMSNVLYDILQELNSVKGKLYTTTTTTTVTPLPNLTMTIFNDGPGVNTRTDFTIEWWAKMTSDSNHPRPWSIGSWPSAIHAVSIENGNFYYWINGAIVLNANIPYSYVGTWTHFCVMRASNIVRLYVNGNLLPGTFAIGDLIPGGDLYLGSEGNDSVQNGLMSNFRWNNTSAVYNTAGFTPPTSNLTSISGTQLLIFQGNTLPLELIDNSGIIDPEQIVNGTGIYNSSNPFGGQGSIQFGTV